MNMEIRLPIELKTAVITECWTFEKRAVIQSAPLADDWLASHLSLYMDAEFSCYFGDGESYYDPAYYRDILRIEELPLFPLSEEETLSLIRQNLREGRYVMVMLHQGIEERDGRNDYHEALLYGYDDEKEIFFTPALRMTRLVERELPFDAVHASLVRLKAHMLRVPDDRFFWSREYQYPLSIIQIREDYVPNQVYEALKKIVPEVWGKSVAVTELDADMRLYGEKTVYKGLGCLYGLREALRRTLNGEPMPPTFLGFARNLKKMLEHRQNLLHTMRYVMDRWNIQNDEIDWHVQSYASCCERAENWMSMALKAELTGDTSLYACIAEEIPAAYREEYLMLADFYNLCLAWYYENHTRV